MFQLFQSKAALEHLQPLGQEMFESAQLADAVDTDALF